MLKGVCNGSFIPEDVDLKKKVQRCSSLLLTGQLRQESIVLKLHVREVDF